MHHAHSMSRLLKDPYGDRCVKRVTLILQRPLSPFRFTPCFAKMRTRLSWELGFITGLPHLSRCNLSESQNNFSIVCLDQRPRTFDELVGSLRPESSQLKLVGDFLEAVFYCNSRHWFPSFRTEFNKSRCSLTKIPRRLLGSFKLKTSNSLCQPIFSS